MSSSEMWQVGQVVELKSSGPAMTVTQVLADGKVICSWFSGPDEVKSNSFPSESLREVTVRSR